MFRFFISFMMWSGWTSRVSDNQVIGARLRHQWVHRVLDVFYGVRQGLVTIFHHQCVIGVRLRHQWAQRVLEEFYGVRRGWLTIFHHQGQFHAICSWFCCIVMIPIKQGYYQHILINYAKGVIWRGLFRETPQCNSSMERK